ncbi:MAG: formylglycine-generating enzyme family protein [Microscillaceae bacterium]|jgi:formylglycine-generating enzyme required for sulfatase activity|nr:formylglycine-generating enzyme family protein [Microscillaceae bacterium]
MLIKTTQIESQIFYIQVGDDARYPLPMILVEGGTFEMGGKSWLNDAEPIHSVKLDDFYIGQYLVTQDLWQAVMGENPSNYQSKTRPVEQVSWEDCQVFIQKLNQLSISNLGGQPIKYGAFRLPTEAEWEYAARGGKHWQDQKEYAGSDDLASVAWYYENSFGQTMPVGLKMPNQLGIYDLSGNAWEWCADHYDKNFYQQCAEQGVVHNPLCRAETTSNRVNRGGGYFHFVEDCRVAYRRTYHAEARYYNLGFRLGFSLPFI